MDVDTDTVTATIRELPPIRDVVFGDQDMLIYVAAEGLSGIRAFDATSGQLVNEISLAAPAGSEVATLVRTPDGRRLLAQLRGGPIEVLDIRESHSVDRIEAPSGAGPAVPSGTGAFLLIPDASNQTLVVRSDRLPEPATLRGASSVNGVYTAWLDSVAFVASAAQRRLMVYDLDGPSLAGAIALAGPPVRGAVTADSLKLYIPISEPPLLVVVDGIRKSVITVIDLPSRPLAAIVAGGWGVCH